MEALTIYRVSWLGLLVLGLGLLACYFLLRLVYRLLAGASVSSRLLALLRRLLRSALLLYEPLAILAWSAFFVFINPSLHSLLLGVLVLGGYAHIRSYVSGRLVRLGHAISPGKKLRTSGVQGVVSRLGNLGLYLQADNGRHYLSYFQLLTDGYTLLSGEDVSGVYHLSVEKEGEDTTDGFALNLMDILATAPYLDWNHKPEWITESSSGNRLEFRVVLKQDGHLWELMQLLEELGFSCKIIK
ncbi:MAG: hypothetical protein H6558_08715 [Lewinellaceae bacterium]|nr:hypothetical protein [Lewinellaceae bacterium]MCB9287374.1 hypothetical protein [Lewinellaceae bacterium]